MASEKAIYAPGELDRLKKQLGPVDDAEARRMQKILGGEVGRERADGGASAYPRPAGGGASKKPRHTVDIASEGAAGKRKSRSLEPRRITPVKLSYFERIKMDSCCGEAFFGIKTPWQVFLSKLSFFHTPADVVSAHFVRHNLDEYYKHIEILVTTVRLLLPKGNSDRAGKLKKISLTSFLTLDVFRQWKINLIAQEISKLQARPRAVYTLDFQPMLREIYRPLYILEDLTIEIDIEDAFNMLYKVLFLEAPTPETEKDHKKMTNAIASYRYIKESIRYLLYPLLMKNLAAHYVSYENFFPDYADKYLAFLGVDGEDKIRPASSRANLKELLNEEAKDSAGGENAEIQDLIDESPAEQEQKAEEAKAAAAEKKAFDRGITALEMLFPKAGWQIIAEYPDFFPYFAAIISFKKGCELISPRDPSQLALALSAVIEEMLTGFRAIKFKDEAADLITTVLDEWNTTFDESFYNSYLRLIDEYVGVIKSSGGNAKTNFAMALMNNIQWARRYYFFPLYDYKSGMPPTFPRKEIRSMFALARRLRKVLTDIAVDIDEANRAGGSKANAPCKSIANPWEPINFPVANPISHRIDKLLPKEQKTNVSLIFFVLSAVTVLDSHMNNPSSIAYTGENREVFRSVNNEGREPILWVDKRTDIETLFKESLAARKGAPQ